MLIPDNMQSQSRPVVGRQLTYSVYTLGCQPVAGRLAPLPPLRRCEWLLAELPADAAALQDPAALQEDHVPARQDNIPCYLFQLRLRVVLTCAKFP